MRLNIYSDSVASEFVDSFESEVRDYRRVSQVPYGDYEASFTLEHNPNKLQQLFEDYLGYWMREYGSELSLNPAFCGQIHTLNLFLDGRVYRRSLATVYNQIIVAYATTAGGATVYELAGDSDSILRYEERWLKIDVSAPISAAAAAVIASDALAQFATEQAELVGFFDEASQPNRLEVVVYGSARILDVQIYEPKESPADLDVAIRSMVGESPTITEGIITANSAIQVADPDDDYLFLIDRLNDLLKASGADWRTGCFGKPELNYYQIDKDAPRYLIEFAQGSRRFRDLQRGEVFVPDEMIRPGQYVRVAGGAFNQPDLLLLDSVTYTQDGELSFGFRFEDRLALLQANLEAGLAGA